MKQLLLFVLLVFSTSANLFSQKKLLLEKNLDTIANNNHKVDFINNWLYHNYRANPKESKYYVDLYSKIAQNNDYDLGYGILLIRKALIEQNINKNYNQAIIYYNNAQELISEDNQTTEFYTLYLNRGFAYKKNNQLELAVLDFLKLLKLSDQNNNQKMKVYSLNYLGLIKKQTRQYYQALNYYKRAIPFLDSINKPTLRYNINNNIANVYSILGNYNKALEYYKNIISHLKKSPNKIKLAKTYHNIGNCFLEIKNNDLALEYLKLSLQLKEKIGDEKFCITTYSSIGHAYYKLNELDKSLLYHKKSYKIAEKYNVLNLSRNCSREIFKCYTYLNQPDSTIKYFNIYNTTKDSIIQRTNLKQIAEIETKYETEKKESQIVLLEKENQRKIIERNSIFVLFLLLLSYVVFIVRSYYKNKKQTRMLSLQNNRIGWHGELLRRKNIDLEESNQTKNKLFQIISHDLRSPLASVSGISKLIPMFIQMEKYNELEDTSKDLEDSVSRVLNLTDNLLSWSMNQSGRLPFKPCVISLHNILSGIIETYQSVAQQKKIHLQLITNENMFIRADRPMFETVIRNLLNNAIKFTPCGGVIILGAEEKNNYTEIWLKDSGTGIPADQLPHLFEISNTKSHYGTEGERGSGLGLLLCKDFIEKNKGNIRVESIVEEGSTFTISIPTAQKIVSEKEELAYT